MNGDDNQQTGEITPETAERVDQHSPAPWDVAITPEPMPTTNKPRGTGTSPAGLRKDYLVLALCIFLPYGLFFLYSSIVGRSYWGIAISLGLLLSPIPLARLTLQERHMFSLIDLEYSNDKRNVGALVDALAWPDDHARHIAISGLTRLLPTLTVDDGYLLTRKQRSALYDWLQPTYISTNNRFIISILTAIELLKDLEAEPVTKGFHRALERRKRVGSEAKQLDDVCRAAAQCVEYLENCKSSDEIRTSLLRASHRGPTTGDELLKASSTNSTFSLDELLRATENWDGKDH